jgi:DNA-binding transcriptional regulator YiaG
MATKTSEQVAASARDHLVSELDTTKEVTEGSGGSYTAFVRRKYGVSRALFARMVNVSERTLAEWEKTGPSDGSKLRTVRELDRLYEALSRVVKPEAIGPWLTRRNDAFDELTPMEMIESGQSGRLWQMIFFMESGVSF